MSDPNTVQAQNVAIEFYGVPQIGIPRGGTVQLTAPNNINVKSAGVTCKDKINVIDCSVTISGKSFVITTSVDLPAG